MIYAHLLEVTRLCSEGMSRRTNKRFDLPLEQTDPQRWCSLVGGLLFAQNQELHECLLHMHAVLRLVPDDTLGAIDDTGCYLLATMGRQAMHKQALLVSQSHHLVIDTPISKGLSALFLFILKAHASPDISGHQMSASASLVGVGKHRECLSISTDQIGIKLIALR